LKRTSEAGTASGRTEIARWIAGGEFLARHLIRGRAPRPVGRPNVAVLERLVAEAEDLSRRARVPDTGLAGEATPEARICRAFRGILARDLHDWLSRAEAAVGTAKTRGATGGATRPLGQLRCLIDAANVALMRGSRTHDAWPRFCSLTDRSAPPAAE
jgi:hypothetical protein